jgi:hypothetical protein
MVALLVMIGRCINEAPITKNGTGLDSKSCGVMGMVGIVPGQDLMTVTIYIIGSTKRVFGMITLIPSGRTCKGTNA